MTLIRAGWNELLIAGFAFRSTRLDDGILWADGQVITRENAHLAGVGEIFDRVLVELVGKMKEMKMVRSRVAMPQVLSTLEQKKIMQSAG